MNHKRVICLILAAVMLFGLIPSVALPQVSAAVGDTKDELHGTLDTTKSVSLPVTIHNYPNDGMLFEYASYVGSPNDLYARRHAAQVSPGYGEAWYIDQSDSVKLSTGESFTDLGVYYIVAWNSVVANTRANPDGTKPYYYVATQTAQSSQNTDVNLYSAATASVGEAQRRWHIYQDANGYWIFLNEATGEALNVANGVERGDVISYPLQKSGTNDRWEPEALGNGSYRFIAKFNSNQCLDLDDGYLNEGQNVHVYNMIDQSTADAKTQSWAVIPVNGTVGSLSGTADDAMRVTNVHLDDTATATILSQGMLKAEAKVMTLVYHVEQSAQNTTIETLTAPFKLASAANPTLVLDVFAGTAKDGTDIWVYTSGANANETTQYLMAESAGDGSYYLRWYRADANGKMTDTDYYIGGLTDQGSKPVCKTKANANRFYFVANDDGTYSLMVADKTRSNSDEALFLEVPTLASRSYIRANTWTNSDNQKFHIKNYAHETVSFSTSTYALNGGFDGNEPSGDGISLELSTAPGYHSLTVDLTTLGGRDAAEKLTSLTLTTPTGRSTLSIAAVACYGTEEKATAFANGVQCAMIDVLKWGEYEAEIQWRQSTEADYNANSSSGDVRKYNVGNNLAYGMLLPNSSYGAGDNSSYYRFDNFGYAYAGKNDTTVKENLTKGNPEKYSYAVSSSAYYVPTDSNQWGRWYTRALELSGTASTLVGTDRDSLTTIDGTTYSRIDYFLPNLNSYLNGMATVGLTEYELGYDSSSGSLQLSYTQRTVQKLAELLKASLAIPEQATTGYYNYNYVQGEKILGNGTKDWAQDIRSHVDSNSATALSGMSWDEYAAEMKPSLDMTWTQAVDSGYIKSYLDVAYWMLNTLYKDNNGISSTVGEYNQIILTQETDANGNTYYAFDGGYNNLVYDAVSGSIYHGSKVADKEFVSYAYNSTNGNYWTTSHPFLPTTGSATYSSTASPYFMDDGVSTSDADYFGTYLNRDYNFTMDGHGEFIFQEEDDLYFRFEGDDDVYLFINNKLVMDIGGAHGISKSFFHLNDYIEELELVDGESYDFDFYYMERHGYGSNIRIETNISVVSKDVTTRKGALQDDVEVANGGLVDASKSVDYYFTLTNNGQNSLQNLSFLDHDLDFTASYEDVTLGSYTLGGTKFDRKLEDLQAVLILANGDRIKITFESETALKSFLTTVTCTGHTSPGLAPGESLTLSGVRYGMTESGGLFRNTVYTKAGGLSGKATFSVYAGTAQRYYMWAEHPIAVSAADAFQTVLGEVEAARITGIVPCTAQGRVTAERPLADGLYSIGASGSASNTWTVSGDTVEISAYSSGAQLFYLRYVAGGYYTVYHVTGERYVCSGDGLSLRSMTRKEAESTAAALWRITKDAATGYVIRPRANTGVAVSLSGSSLTLSETASGWCFNAHANGKEGMNLCANSIFVYDYAQQGDYTNYYTVTYSDADGETQTAVVPVVIHVIDVVDNTYVLDYGLPVALNSAEDGLMLNDHLDIVGGKTASLIEGMVENPGYYTLKDLATDGRLTENANRIRGTQATKVEAAYGDFAWEDSRLTFSPDAIMDGVSTAQVVVRTYDATQTPTGEFGKVEIHKEVETYQTVTVVPASVVYYEDNFVGFDYNENNGNVIETGNGDGNYQSADQGEQYGHDGSYEGEGAQTSGGSVTKITVNADAKVLTFSFQGTGFEIVSRCSANASATIIATVYDKDGNAVRTIPVITEYDNGGDSGNEAVYQVPVVSVNDLEPGKYTVTLSVTAKQNYDGWTVTYQSYNDGEIVYKIVEDATGKVYYKYYNVTEGTSRFTDADGKECKNPMFVVSYLYIDGVRIFNPLSDGTTNDPDGYYIGTESGAVIVQIHDSLEQGEMFAATYDDENYTVGTGFASFTENRNNNLITGQVVDSIGAYSLIGPNNEVYLDGLNTNQALAFYVKPIDSVAPNERTLQIGVRLLDADALVGQESSTQKTAHLHQSYMTDATPTWTVVADVTSGTEMYYRIDPTHCKWDPEKGAYLVILRPVDGILSFTGLKFKGYELVKAFDETDVIFSSNGKLTEASIALVEAMLEKFRAQTDSETVVDIPEAVNTTISISLGDPSDDPTDPFVNPFTDVFESDWYYSYVMAAAEAELVNGYQDSTFRPANSLTRAEAATLLYRLAGSPEVTATASFTDLPNEWYREAIAWAQTTGVVTGYPDGTFRPDETVTREQFVTMLWRLEGKPEATKELKGFEDTASVSEYAKTAFAWAVENGIVNGTTSHDKEGTYLAPQDKIKRCEVAKILCVFSDSN